MYAPTLCTCIKLVARTLDTKTSAKNPCSKDIEGSTASSATSLIPGRGGGGLTSYIIMAYGNMPFFFFWSLVINFGSEVLFGLENIGLRQKLRKLRTIASMSLNLTRNIR